MLVQPQLFLFINPDSFSYLNFSGVKDAIVVDIGGTSTTVGSLQGGLPRLSSLDVCLGRVNTNLRMPDVLSIGLGGGSIVTYEVVDNLVRLHFVFFGLLLLRNYHKSSFCLRLVNCDHRFILDNSFLKWSG